MNKHISRNCSTIYRKIFSYIFIANTWGTSLCNNKFPLYPKKWPILVGETCRNIEICLTWVFINNYYPFSLFYSLDTYVHHKPQVKRFSHPTSIVLSHSQMLNSVPVPLVNPVLQRYEWIEKFSIFSI